MKHSKNNKWFALIFAMWIVVSVSLTIIFLWEYIMPYAKDTKNIEFSSNAFYQSYSATEQAMSYIQEEEVGSEDQNQLSLGAKNDIAYTIEARWNRIPPAWEWNSEYDPDWNTLSEWNPIQLEVWNGVWDNAFIYFRVPQISNNYSNLSRPVEKEGGLIWWQLTSETDTLNSADADNRVQWSDFAWVTEKHKVIVWEQQWETLEWDLEDFNSFYSNNCSSAPCTLRFFVINQLQLNNTAKTSIPFFEYQIGGADELPLRYTRINATGYSYWFKKDFYSLIPQKTVNEFVGVTVVQ